MPPTVILGGGIIGLSTAYYLALHRPPTPSDGDVDDNAIHIIDPAPSLLMSASGYAGGFLAKDWFSHASASLGALSFRLHRELSDAHDGGRNWGYASSTAYSLSIDERGVSGKKRVVRKKQGGDDGWMVDGSSRADVSAGVQSSNTLNHAPGGTVGGNGTNRAETKNGDGADSNEMLNSDGTPAWITRQEGGSLEVISSEDGCAQVEPRELCEWLVDQLKQRDVKFHLGSKATGVTTNESGQVAGVKVRNGSEEETELECKDLVIAAGAWTPRVFRTLFPQSKTNVGISQLAGYSIVVRSPRYSRPIVDPMKHGKDEVTGMCHSVFCAPGPNWTFAPEAISRMTRDGKPEVYVAGLNVPSLSLPDTVMDVKGLMDDEKMEIIKDTTINLMGMSNESDDLVEDDLTVVREGLCFRPVSNRGTPIVARIEPKQLGRNIEMHDNGNVYMAAGHGPWGISMSLGTGLVVAEMILGKKTSADISGLRLR